MNAAWLIAKKRDGETLTNDELGDLIRGYAEGDVPDYQMAAWAMAVYLQGMTVAETTSLTDHMLRSGIVLEWADRAEPYVDKHSTGGIGDKVSIPLAPALACCGARVPMISGRGLGATGGTLDKLESILGFQTDLSIDRMRALVDQVGCVICSASEELAPADRKLYALRDVTATVPSLPLITASIMSKKLAEGLDALVLDVKHGSGAFMKTREEALRLARSLVNTGERMGVATSAILTDMNQPLGRMVGAAVEIDESIDCLQGAGPADLRALTVELGGAVLTRAGLAENEMAGARQIERVLDSGHALEKFHEMVAAQGGDLSRPRPVGPETVVLAERESHLAAVDAEAIGWALIEMGGGRKRLSDPVDHSVGIETLVRIGDRVDAQQPLARLFAAPDKAKRTLPRVLEAFRWSEDETEAPRLIGDRVA